MGTAAGALSRVVRANQRLAKAEAEVAALRAKRDEALREALEHRENTYAVIVERAGIARATITKAAHGTTKRPSAGEG